MPVIDIEGYGVVYFERPCDEAKVKRQLEVDAKVANKAWRKRGENS